MEPDKSKKKEELEKYEQSKVKDDGKKEIKFYTGRVLLPGVVAYSD